MTGLTIDNPVKFSTAILSNRLVPGDTLYLRGGTYTGDWGVVVGGTPGLPIKIMPYNGEQVIIDGSITFLAPYVEIYDIDFTDSRTDRHITTNAVRCDYPGIGIYGCRITDLHTSGVNWFGSGVGELAECVIYNNGNRFADNSIHGHDLYTHNDFGGTRIIARNILR